MEDAYQAPKKRRKPKKDTSEIEVIETAAEFAPNEPISDFKVAAKLDEAPISVWIQLEGCDPTPVSVDGELTVHDLKLLLGGFPAASAAVHRVSANQSLQKQQIELLGLRGVRPQQLKLKIDDSALSPPTKMNSVASDGSIIQVTVVPSPIASSLSGHSASASINGTIPATDSETLRMMFEMRQEIDMLRRRLYSPSAKDMTATSTDLAPYSAPSDNGAIMSTSETNAFINRLELVEAKLDLKNTQLETIMKELKTVTLALRGLAPAAANAVPEKGPSNLVDGMVSVKCKQTIEGHAGPVWALTKTDSYLISGSTDCTVQAWDMQTMRPVQTMRGHTSIVHSVEVWNNMIISGSDDRSLKFWDMDQDFKCTKTIRANNVACVLRAASNHLFAGLYKTVKVWNLETGEHAGDLDTNHNHWVRALNVTKGHLYSGCYNVINMIDLGTFKHMKSMTGNVGSIYSIVVENNLLYAATYANAICVYDLRTFECVRTLTGHTGAVYSLALSKGTGKLYSGSYDTTIRVWDLNSLTPVQRFVGHTSSVESLLTTDAGLYSASTDATIKLWR